jgi:hypothetical protein
MCAQSQCEPKYCAYQHFSAMLGRCDTDWLLSMFEVYFDDSGTDLQSPMAIASCYISTKRGWDSFVTAWDEIRSSEGFDVFHMVDFAASHDPSKKPFCDWDYIKRGRVYRRLAKAINDNKRIGIAFAVPQDVFNLVVPTLPGWMRQRLGQYPYTAAVRFLMGAIRDWRERYGITLPMQYVFDWTTDESLKAEVSAPWNNIPNRDEWLRWYGIEDPKGFSFQEKAFFKPLQAADILAWQFNNHMKNVILEGKNDADNTHCNFRLLREDQEMVLGFYTEAQFRIAVEREMAFLLKRGNPEILGLG